MQGKTSKSHAVLYSKIYQLPNLLSILLKASIKHNELTGELTHSLYKVKASLIDIIQNSPIELDLNEVEKWKIDDFSFSSELLLDALCMMIGDTFCHIHTIRETDNYCLPFIKNIDEAFSEVFPEEKISNATAQTVIISTFGFMARCSSGVLNDEMESKIDKAAIRCAKSYDNRYNMLSEPLAKEIIMNYASIKGSEFKSRSK
jgi:hypothetical protein